MLRYAPSTVRATAGAIATLLAVLILAGTTYQGVATSLERHRFERPGGLASVGDYQLHIYCVGEGSPTVVLEAAAGTTSSAWGLVQPEVARTTRVCSYDRSGLGWSEGDGRYVPSRVSTDLRALLDQAGEQRPLVVVGYELGASFARLFAARYPADTAAIVLVDDPLANSVMPPPAMVTAWPWLARVGLLRVTGTLSPVAAGLPGDAGGAMRAFLNRPDHLTQAARELSRFEEVRAAARDARLESSVTLVAVPLGTRGQPAVLVTVAHATAVTRAIEATVLDLRVVNAANAPEP